MARTRSRPRPDHAQTLTPIFSCCPECGHQLCTDYHNQRTITTLGRVLQLTLHIRRCHHPHCSRFHRPYRPEAEPHFALPHHEFGLDVLAHVGYLRYAEHRSIPEIHQDLTRRRVAIAMRSVTNLLDRYDELKTLAITAPRRLDPLLRQQGRVVLAVDGLRPQVGHEVLWVFRDCLSGEVLLAKSLLSATIKDLSALLKQVRKAVPVPITGVISDGEGPIRQAVAQVLPGVPHQLCHFHYLRDAAKPITEADRRAKKELKKRVRGVRVIERGVEEAEDLEAEIVRGYCAAVRSALTDDGGLPLKPPGLRLQDRLEKIVGSLDKVAQEVGQLPRGLQKLGRLIQRGLAETAALWPPVRAAYRWVQRVARLLENRAQWPAREMRRRLRRLVGRMRRAATQAKEEAVRKHLHQFVKVTQSHWKGLFACYESAEIPRTNNDLEQLFGSHRYHERRASGRKQGSRELVVMGSVRVVSGLATRLQGQAELRLPTGYVPRWRQLRAELEKRRGARRQRRRFRQDPDSYLQHLEELALQLSLPP